MVVGTLRGEGNGGVGGTTSDANSRSSGLEFRLSCAPAGPRMETRDENEASQDLHSPLLLFLLIGMTRT